MPSPRTPVRALAVCVLLLCPALVGPAVSSAATSVPVSGTIAVKTNVVQSTFPLGNTTVTNAVAHVLFAGGLIGPSTETYGMQVFPGGRTVQWGSGHFSGKIGGRTGTLGYVFTGNATSGKIIVVRGGGGLRHATGGVIPYHFNTSTGLFDYSGHVIFG